MIMIVTDGATETASNVFLTRNWIPNNVSTCHATEVNIKEKINFFFCIDMFFFLFNRQECLLI